MNVAVLLVLMTGVLTLGAIGGWLLGFREGIEAGRVAIDRLTLPWDGTERRAPAPRVALTRFYRNRSEGDL